MNLSEKTKVKTITTFRVKADYTVSQKSHTSLNGSKKSYHYHLSFITKSIISSDNTHYYHRVTVLFPPTFIEPRLRSVPNCVSNQIKNDIGKDENEDNFRCHTSLFWFKEPPFVSNRKEKAYQYQIFFNKRENIFVRKNKQYSYRVTVPFTPTIIKPRLRRVSLSFPKQTWRCCPESRKRKRIQLQLSKLTIRTHKADILL
jgi:hypothetical protein